MELGFVLYAPTYPRGRLDADVRRRHARGQGQRRGRAVRGRGVHGGGRRRHVLLLARGRVEWRGQLFTDGRHDHGLRHGPRLAPARQLLMFAAVAAVLALVRHWHAGPSSHRLAPAQPRCATSATRLRPRRYRPPTQRTQHQYSHQHTRYRPHDEAHTTPGVSGSGLSSFTGRNVAIATPEDTKLLRTPSYSDVGRRRPTPTSGGARISSHRHTKHTSRKQAFV